jgi:cytochrome P450
MASYPVSQSRLRRELQAAHGVAVDSQKDMLANRMRRLPTVDEILDTRVPFLDAVIEETIRCSHIVPVTAREALVDTNILGHHIPKGTHVYLLSNGPSFLLPALAVDENLRTDAARAARDLHGVWDPANVADFVPERWLRPDGAFDPLAGPQMAFGGGPRGCFGRKMVYLELRIVVTILTLAFEFCALDDGLNTYGTRESSTEAPQDCYVKLRPVADFHL